MITQFYLLGIVNKSHINDSFSMPMRVSCYTHSVIIVWMNAPKPMWYEN